MNKGVIYSVLAALAFSFQNVIVKDYPYLWVPEKLHFLEEQ